MTGMEQSPHRILLVEDNPGDARLLRETLADAAGPDLEIVAVETLGAALEAVKAASYDLLLVDLSLPDSQGLATVDQLYHAALDTPVVVMTGLDDEAVGIEAVRKGAQDYLIKGQIDARQLARAIRYAIGRHQADQAIAERTTELERSRELVRSLGARNARLLEEERRRIARELHDEMGQQLAALRMEIAVLRQGGASAERAGSDAALGMLLGRVDGLVVSVRRIVAELRPPALDGGLAAALEWLGSEFERQTQVSCEVDIDACADLLSADAAAMVFRIAQESLNNVRRHAAARGASLHLRRAGAGCELHVRDNGKGFSASMRTAGFGILGMEERARALGGTLAIDSRPGRGTEVSLRLPLSEAGPAHGASDRVA